MKHHVADLLMNCHRPTAGLLYGSSDSDSPLILLAKQTQDAVLEIATTASQQQIRDAYKKSVQPYRRLIQSV